MKRVRENESNGGELIKKLATQKLEQITLKPTDQIRMVYLNADKTSWIKLEKLNETDGLTMSEFEDLWALKPKEKLQIKIGEQLITCPRYARSYLRAYAFSGLVHEAEPRLPNSRIERLLDYCRTRRPELNQSLINWYERDGSIGKHADDTRQLVADSEIFSLSFGPARRTFVIEPKDKSTRLVQIYNVELEHNTLIIMGGKCQKTHYHSVPKKSFGLFQCAQDERRLNITFRCFK